MPATASSEYIKATPLCFIYRSSADFKSPPGILKSCAPADADKTTSEVAPMRNVFKALSRIIPPLAALRPLASFRVANSARDNDFVGASVHSQSQHRLRQSCKIVDAVRRKRRTNLLLGRNRISYHKLCYIISVEFLGHVDKRCMDENQHAAAPTQLVVQLLHRLAKNPDTGRCRQGNVTG